MIEFKKIIQSSTYLNPFNKFEPYEGAIEIRWDPLTRMTSRIVHYPARKFKRFNCDDIIKTSTNTKCPFCPENINSMTSRFDGGFYGFERMEEDGITIIPNVLTFDKYCLVAILSKEHFVDMHALIENDYLVRGIKALIKVLRIINEKDENARFYSINCNYMPMSGSSILHPHMQAIAGEYPTNYHGIMLEASNGFLQSNKKVFWEMLMEEEEARGERYIASTGTSRWYMPFAPRGNIDVGCIFNKNSLFELEDSDFRHFSKGLNRVLMYFDKENVSGFNLSLFSGIIGQTGFRANMRIVARRFLPPMNAADSNYFDKLHMESACLFFPEDVSNSIRETWEALI